MRLRRSQAPLVLLALVWSCALGPACVLDWDGPRPARPDLDVAAPPPDQGVDQPRPDAPLEAGRLDFRFDSFFLPVNWVTIRAGTFTMGSPTNEPCREYPVGYSGQETEHTVSLTYDFEIMDNEVSEGHFEQLMGFNEAHGSGSIWPYRNASWHEAAAYCNALSPAKQACYQRVSTGTPCTMPADCGPYEACFKDTCARYEEATAYAGKKITTCPGYRLPTEAEWEYAYRAATTTALYSGAMDILKCKASCSTSAAAEKIAWYCDNCNNKPQRLTDLKQANGWQLYNMAGSVQEWCHDAYKEDLGSTKVTNPVNSSATIKDVFGVARGGSFAKNIGWLRAAHRAKLDRNKRRYDVGLRCVRSLLPASDAGPADAAVDAGAPGG